MCRNRGALTAGNEALAMSHLSPSPMTLPNDTVFCARTNVFLFSRDNCYIFMNVE